MARYYRHLLEDGTFTEWAELHSPVEIWGPHDAKAIQVSEDEHRPLIEAWERGDH